VELHCIAARVASFKLARLTSYETLRATQARLTSPYPPARIHIFRCIPR
jgi:hypothetical protein